MGITLPDTVYQVLTPEGQVVGEVPHLPPGRMVELYRWMVFGRAFSDRMVALQRQGRMGTFGPLNGQEAASVGIAAPLQAEDWLVGSYREILSYFIKGVPPLAIMEVYRGYVSARYPWEARCLPIQIVLATQVLHAVGLAMAIKYDGKPDVAVGVCGEGATSEGDFNEALNFAGVFKAPAVIVVQNNCWAISVPRSAQTAAGYIAHRGPGFGVPGYIVDGNDVLAMYQVMADCVARARAGEGPSLIEALTYRMGAHTTADDPRKYRPEGEMEEWSKRDPISRFRKFLLDQNMLSEQEDRQMAEEITTEIQGVVEALESRPAQDPNQLFDNVFETATPQLESQRSEMLLRNARTLGKE
ncbi:MAG: pyruvate dehydrogenase (acetyl-transferring) E1 component subunit alpha [Chloroflexi bacterium]|nr:pyruvate dehydrogenase (acetyl-transferring) E1 component subunit alpha [Chloroflexota bacterium]